MGENYKLPLSLRILTWLHIIVGLWAWSGVGNSIAKGFKTGDIWNGFVSKTPGILYMVFNVTTKILPGIILTYILIFWLALWYWIHAKIHKLKAINTNRDDGKFFDSPGFRAMLIFAIIFGGSGLIQTGLYGFGAFSGMISDTVAGPLILVLLGPLFGFVLWGFCVILVIVSAALVLLYWVAVRLVQWMQDYALNF